jgi:drug/metabolite transporter (DMT)-like permease
LVPVLVIPVVIVVYGEKVSLRAVFGALLALAGVALLYR